MQPSDREPAPFRDARTGGEDINTIGARLGVDRLRLRATMPLLLLPVRIETRFSDENATPELWVRIYPDQIAIDTHEGELTDVEKAAGQTYWDALWRAGNPPENIEDVKGPWRALAAAYGPQRAAWIALQMTPANVDQQPKSKTVAGAEPTILLAPPNPQLRASSWQKAPQASALPDRWTVVTYFNGVATPHLNGPISQLLAVGLTPGTTSFPDGLPVDEGMRWLVDFQAALDAGMAVRIPLTSEQRRTGFERIVVYGVRPPQHAVTSSTEAFVSLLAAHHYTDGLSLLPQGSPTNNTPDASSAFQSTDPNYDVSFTVERHGPLTQNLQADGAIAAELLSVPLSTFDHVRYSDRTDMLNARHMITALWPATLGYFLRLMMADSFTPSQLDEARHYTIEYVRPRGPLPALRVGTTPYGILPVTSLRQWQPLDQDSFEQGLVDFLRKAWPTWLASSGSAPHVGGTNDPDKDLAGILGMDASSMKFRGRYVLGDEFMWNLLNWIMVPSEGLMPWWNEHWIRGRVLLDTFGYTTLDPKVIHTSLQPASFPVPYPTVQDGPLSETEPLKADATVGAIKINYITWLRSASIVDIRNENYPGPKPTSILYRILRQSMLLEYVSLAREAQILNRTIMASLALEPELVNVAARQHTVTPWEILNNRVSSRSDLTWARYLETLEPQPQSQFARLGELRQSLDYLANLPTAELDRLLTETLDIASHRLDAWITALATKLLQKHSSDQASTLQLGSFGWLENLRPAQPPPLVEGIEREAVALLDQRRAHSIGQSRPLSQARQPREDNGGFIHAPSLSQAAVGAVLRNGYMTHHASSQEGAMAVDLSSERVRKALDVLDGVRQGQALGALLGFRFEMDMHQLQLDKYIQPFRNRYPLVANKLLPSSQPAEAVADSNVVDGLALQTAWVAGQLPQGANWSNGLPPAGSDQDAVILLLRNLEDIVDALSDVSLAESVFQVMRGNFGRAGGMLDAVSKGLHAPEPQVVDTPRGGLDLTHRVMKLFAGPPQMASAWNSINPHVRAQVEPWLDAWLATLLPDPTNVDCQVTYKDVSNRVVTKLVRLLDLDIGPLDLLSLVNAADIAQQSELETRILFKANVPTAASEIKIVYHPDPPISEQSITFPDLLFAVRALNNLLGNTHPLLPQDLIEPERTAEHNGGIVDLTDLNARAATARQELSDVVTALANALTGLPSTVDAVRTSLLNASYFGVQGTIPQTEAAALSGQASSVLNILQKRLTTANTITLPAKNLDDPIAVIQSVFGPSFVVLPRFTPPEVANLRQAFAQSSALLAGDILAPARWLQQLTHIRPAISCLDEVYTVAQIIAEANPLTLTIGQIPYTPNDRWLALKLDGSSPAKGRVALEAIISGNYTGSTSWCGLLLDEWVERIPNVQESAGLAFHYEEPKSQAPQAMLLAVCPSERAYWDDALIQSILEETMDLFKIRSVDLDSLQEVGQILPALYFALNLKQETVSTLFTAIAHSEVLRNAISNNME